jgi:hypothetical protein
MTSWLAISKKNGKALVKASAMISDNKTPTDPKSLIRQACCACQPHSVSLRSPSNPNALTTPNPKTPNRNQQIECEME